MRRAARTDTNHAAIVSALRGVGCSVLDLSRVGAGCPDLLIWAPGRVKHFLAEVKDGAKSPSRRRLNAAQERWHASWGGPVVVLESVEDALRLVGTVKVRVSAA